MSESRERQQRFRSAIAAYIYECREAKLKDASKEADAAASKYEYATWLADAARWGKRLQMVTHVLKATHPDARGSSLRVVPATLPQHAEIGSHVLGNLYAEDVVSDAGAAALYVWKFLKIGVDGRPLVDWLQQDDVDLLAALHQDETTAHELASAFKMIRPTDVFVSDTRAKQMYWSVCGDPVDDADFHLLQPLFSSSLAHAVHAEIQDASFGEANVQARQAKRDKQAHDGAYRDYRQVAVRKLGGTKPQNISQLNSERGGMNYLLASLPPPAWSKGKPPDFLNIKSVLTRFERYEDVAAQIKALCKFLKSNPDPTMETRMEREQMEQTLGESLAAFGLAMQQLLAPGWTRDPACDLPRCEQLWLDPQRASLPPRDSHREEDEAFARDFEWKDWPDEVAHRFGNWLNEILRKQGLSVGAAEHAHWARQAIVEVAAWPAPMQRRALPMNSTQEASHG